MKCEYPLHKLSKFHDLAKSRTDVTYYKIIYIGAPTLQEFQKCNYNKISESLFCLNVNIIKKLNFHISRRGKSHSTLNNASTFKMMPL